MFRGNRAILAILALAALGGCACDPAIIENRSDTPVEVTLWAMTGRFRYSSPEVYRRTVPPGETWHATCADRVDGVVAQPPAADLRITTLPPAAVGRTWLLDLEQDLPFRIRVLGESGDLRFQSLREDGAVRSAVYLTVREEAWVSGAE